jgi:hypothetical protein
MWFLTLRLTPYFTFKRCYNINDKPNTKAVLILAILYTYKIMRIAYLIVAFSVFDVTAFAFSRSKVEHVMSQSSCRRQHIIGATLHQSARLNESSTVGLPVNLKVLKNKYDAPKRDSEEKSVVNFRTMLLAIVLALTIGGPAFADEYGVEKEAPTLFTGETVEVCTIANI